MLIQVKRAGKTAAEGRIQHNIGVPGVYNVVLG